MPEWGSTAAAAPLTGTLELGQTHVVRAQPSETRLAPRLVSEREALVLFTPDAPLGDGEVLVLALFEDANAALPLGTLPMLDTAAGNTVPILEQALTLT